jgi:hypothetical protein
MIGTISALYAVTHESQPNSASNYTAGDAALDETCRSGSAITYATNNGTITIMQYTGSGGAVTVPNMTNGLLVTSITNNAFMGAGVTSITIPNSVTNIGAEAFSDCGSLTNALIGSSVQSIGRNAFMDCVHLKGVYFLGNAPGSIGSQLFGGGVSATAYYLPSTAGWGSMFAGIPAVPWNPLPVVGITTYNSQPVLFFPVPASAIIGTNYALQMSTNLIAGNWTTVTNSISFICLQITNAPGSGLSR